VSPSPLDAWTEVPAAGVRWWVTPELRETLIGPAGLRMDDWLREGRATVVKQGPHRVVWRVQLADGQIIYVKHNLLPDVRAWLRQLVRPSKSRMEFDRAVAVASRGVPTVEPLALGERRTILGACDSYLVTRALENTETLNSFLASTLAPMPAPRHSRIRKRLATAIGEFVARLHDAGIRHDDLHAANILVRLSDTDDIKLFLIDLNAVRLSPALDWQTSRDNLVLVARWFAPRVSRADRLRFWRAYYQARKFGAWPRGSHGHREHFVKAGEVERCALESTLTFWKNRDPRCFRSNKYFRRIRWPGVIGHAVADFDAHELAAFLADPDAPFRQPGIKLYKDSRGSTVAEIDCVHAGTQRSFIYKRFRVGSWTDPLASLVRPSPALRSWKFGHGFRERCLPTARPLMVLHRAKAGMHREAYLLTEKIDNALDLHRFASHLATMPPEQSRPRIRIAVDAVARALRHLHHWRLSHRDLKATNLIISLDLDRPLAPFLPVDAVAPGVPIPSLLPLPAWPVWFIDLAGVRQHTRLPRSRRIQNLARLHASFHQSRQLTRTDKLRFLRRYLLWNLVGKGGWKSWWKAIEEATTRKVARNRRRGRVLT